MSKGIGCGVGPPATARGLRERDLTEDEHRMPVMHRTVVPLLGALLLFGGCGSSSVRVIAAHGVRLTVPKGWQAVRAASAGPVTDPRTLLVVGTAGVRAKPSRCEIAAYRIPAKAAVVVAVGWRSIADAGGAPITPGRRSLKELVAVRKPSFECFTGRGAAAQVLLGGNLYQVNVLVGARVSPKVVSQALAVARSFDRRH
jgi:hypothetical protein